LKKSHRIRRQTFDHLEKLRRSDWRDKKINIAKGAVSNDLLFDVK
jgi:hypothetical protein